MGVVLSAGTFVVAVHQNGIDDAYISYRYAHNMADGYGLVFNRGEPPVEGYSNLLYTLLMVPAFKLGIQGMGVYWFSVGLNVLASLATLLVIAFHLRRRFGWRAAYPVGLLFSCCPAIWYWSASGLEAAWVLLFQVAAWLAVDRTLEDGDRRMFRAAMLSCALLVLLRADGFVAGLLLAVYLLLRREWRYAYRLARVTAITFAALVLWQLYYYEQPLPNAAYARAASALSGRIAFALSTLADSPQMWPYLALLVAAVAVTAVVWLRTRDAARVPTGVFLAFGLLAYFMYVGGDWMGERFLLISVPAVLCAAIPPGLALTARHQRYAALAVLALLIYPFVPPSTVRRAVFGPVHHSSTVAGGELGLVLRERERGHTIAIPAAGIAPYLSELRTIDMFGLSDIHLARVPSSEDFFAGHNKRDAAYIIHRRPDLIAGHTVDGGKSVVYTSDTTPDWLRDYSVKYLVYVGRKPLPSGSPPVIDVEGEAPDAVASLCRQGYDYAVWKRKDLLHSRDVSARK